MKNRIVCLLIALSAVSGFGQDRNTRARESLLKGEPKQAVELLRGILVNGAKDFEGMLLLGQAFWATGQADSAEYVGEKLISMDNKSADAYLFATKVLADQKKYTEAYALMRKGLKNTKNDNRLMIQLGSIQLANDSTEQAIVSYSKAREVEPENPAVYRGLGEAYIKLKADGVAIIQFEEALRVDSNQTDLRYKVAALYKKERRYTEAAKMYQRIIQLDPQNNAAALELGKLYFAAKQYPNASKVFAQYLDKRLDDKEAWTNFKLSVDESKRYDLAMPLLEKALALKKDPEWLQFAGKSAFMLRKYDKSIEYYLLLSQLQPLNAEDLKLLGKSNAETKNDSLAIVFMLQSILKDSAQEDIYNELGSAHMRRKEFAKACPMYSKKIGQDSTYTPAYINLALCLEQTQEWGQAREALTAAIKQSPNYPLAYYHLAYTLSRMDSAKIAKQTYDQFITLVDTNKTKYQNALGDAYRYISWYYLAEKNFPQALDAITNTILYKPDDIELLIWRAQTLHALNKRDEAKKEYQKVLKRDPNNKEAKKGLDILELYN
jgi:tetratricopeptide (TPR) repeat protein